MQVACEDCHLENEKLNAALSAVQLENTRQAGLIQDLENDLMRLQSGGKTPGNNTRSVSGEDYEDLAEVSSSKGNETPHGRALGIPLLPVRSSRVSTASHISYERKLSLRFAFPRISWRHPLGKTVHQKTIGRFYQSSPGSATGSGNEMRSWRR